MGLGDHGEGRIHHIASNLLATAHRHLSFTSCTLTLLLTFLTYHLLVSYNVLPSNSKARSTLRPTFSLLPLLPPFISGSYAAYQLGVNETGFLLELYREYGPVVYLPFPLRQHLILSDRHVRQIYNGRYNAHLSFIPIRKALSGIIFGTSDPALASPDMERQIFPVHAKAMAKGNLKDPIARFQKSVQESVDQAEAERGQGEEASVVVDLVQWTYDLMFKASMAALFGDELDLSIETFQHHFRLFDDAFPLLASGLFPRFVQDKFPSLNPVYEGVKSRDFLNTKFGEWALRTDCQPLDDRDVVKAMSDTIQSLGWSLTDLGSCLLGDFWALLANNPFAISWIMIYLTQIDRKVLEQVLAEVDSVDVQNGASPADAPLPLLTSCIYETLRLHSSPFSIRKTTSTKGSFVFEGVAEIRPGEICVCVPRVGHIDPEVWGENARLWDPKRFFDDGEADKVGSVKSKRIFEVRAFGGGVSIVSGRDGSGG